MAGTFEMTTPIEDDIREVLQTPAADGNGFDALDPDGSTRGGLSEQVVAAMARKALTRRIAGVTFNDVTVHRDGDGNLMKIEVEYLDEVHDPSARTVAVDYR